MNKNYLQNKTEEFSKSVMINFIYENILIQPFDLKKFNYSIAKKIVLYWILFLMKINPNDPSIYESSLFDTQDYLNAKNSYEMLSKQNNSSALLNLWFLYKEGNCVHRDHLKANEYFELAARQNNTNALLILGNLYLIGDGFDQDCQKAKEYYERAAQKNDDLSSQALFYLGNLYFKGNGLKQDYSEAMIK